MLLIHVRRGRSVIRDMLSHRQSNFTSIQIINHVPDHRDGRNIAAMLMMRKSRLSINAFSWHSHQIITMTTDQRILICSNFEHQALSERQSHQ